MFSRHRIQECAVAGLCFAAALVAVVAITWPWVLHFDGEFLRHWDPPFHAWKLEFMARRILAGDIFMSSSDTNMLYPHSGALYFEALQWPMALFAALLFGLTGLSPEFVYHITLLIFWALSAPGMYALLRQLDCRRVASAAGAIIFCILPWRISYMVEFQMEMVFAMPLFFAFLVRFFKTKHTADAIVAVAFWWLLAVSELYEAIFTAMAAFVVVLVFIAKTPSPLRERQFWHAAIAAMVAGAALLCFLLLPYATLRSAGQVLRPVGEVARHSAHPFSYLVPYGRNALYSLNAPCDEFSLYPTIPILLLAFCGACWQIARSVKNRRTHTLSFLLGLLALVSGATFYSLAAVLHFRVGAPVRHLPHLLKYSSLVFLAASMAYAFSGNRKEPHTATFLKAFFAVAVFSLFLSLGPRLALGQNRSATVLVSNSIYMLCYRRILPFLSGFRVVSRFGVLILLFLVCVASVALNAIATRMKGRFAALAGALLAAAIVVAVAIEAMPPRKLVSSYVNVDDQRQSPAVARLVARNPDVTIAALPCGPREIENMRMFSLLKGDFLYIYAWGGFFPEYSQALVSILMSLDTDASHRELSRLYPDCIVLVDNSIPVYAREPIPDRFLKDEDRRIVDFHKFCAEFAEEEDCDGRFTVFRLRPQPRSKRASKIFRSDIARRRPLLSCAVSAESDSLVVFSLNGRTLGSAQTAVDGVARFSCSIPQDALTERPFNELAAKAKNGSALAFTSFTLIGDAIRPEP